MPIATSEKIDFLERGMGGRNMRQLARHRLVTQEFSVHQLGHPIAFTACDKNALSIRDQDAHASEMGKSIN